MSLSRVTPMPLVSRSRNAFKLFDQLAQAIGQELAGRSAILDGEIVHPGPAGQPMFYPHFPDVVPRSDRNAK